MRHGDYRSKEKLFSIDKNILPRIESADLAKSATNLAIGRAESSEGRAP
jgi:hypothetical protein